MITLTKSKEVRFSICFCLCFILDLLMQHKICCVNLIGRSRGTYNMYQTTPTYLKSFPCVYMDLISLRMLFPWVVSSCNLLVLLPPYFSPCTRLFALKNKDRRKDCLGTPCNTLNLDLGELTHTVVLCWKSVNI
jgi:hypothetical protein